MSTCFTLFTQLASLTSISFWFANRKISWKRNILHCITKCTPMNSLSKNSAESSNPAPLATIDGFLMIACTNMHMYSPQLWKSGWIPMAGKGYCLYIHLLKSGNWRVSCCKESLWVVLLVFGSLGNRDVNTSPMKRIASTSRGIAIESRLQIISAS